MKYEPFSKTNKYIVDAAIIGSAFFLAYQIRFEGVVPPSNVFQFWVLLPIVILGRLAMNSWWRVYRRVWRYVSVMDCTQITYTYITFSGALLVIRVGFPDGWSLFRIPLSVIAIEFLISLMGAFGVRLLRRVLYHRTAFSIQRPGISKRVLLVGAGSAGVMTAKELMSRRDMKVVGFLDDDPQKTGSMIGGVQVLGQIHDLPRIVKKRQVNEVVICIVRASRGVLSRIWRICDGLEIKTSIVPSMDEMVGGEVRISRIRQVTVEELLARETVGEIFNKPEIADFYKDKRILITGAGGSIGSELARQLAQVNSCRLLLMDKDEDGLYNLHHQLRGRNSTPNYEWLVADIRSVERVRHIFEKYRPEIVFHAAAHKHVSLMELNPIEAILNNVFGTRNLVEQAATFETPFFVFISTDKAVNPSSVMGMSKCLAELIVQGKRSQSRTRLVCVRFGNVINSRGSVIPLFQKQIAMGGPITLTHPDISRYFMTIPEAVQLLTEVGSLEGSDRSIYVLDMGDPVQIADLARDLIELNGLRPGQDIVIENIGMQPGEKLREELFGNGEKLIPTENPRIFAVKSENHLKPDQLERLLNDLWSASQGDDGDQIRRLFEKVNLVLHN